MQVTTPADLAELVTAMCEFRFDMDPTVQVDPAILFKAMKAWDGQYVCLLFPFVIVLCFRVTDGQDDQAPKEHYHQSGYYQPRWPSLSRTTHVETGRSEDGLTQVQDYQQHHRHQVYQVGVPVHWILCPPGKTG